MEVTGLDWMDVAQGRVDPRIARDRCLAAVSQAGSKAMARRLWVEAKVWNMEAKRMERAGGLEINTRSLPRALGGAAHDLF